MKRWIQTQIQSDSQKLETETDVKFQNIIYYYWDGKKTVNQSQQVGIDFLDISNLYLSIQHNYHLILYCHLYH